MRKRAETEAAIQALGEGISFDADASRLLEKAAKDEADAASRIATLNEQIAALQAERKALTYDDGLLARADDIQLLHDRRIQIRAGKADLPKRRAELAGAEASLNRLAAELEWSGDIDQLMARIPARAKIAALRALVNRRGEQFGAIENAKVAVAEAEEKLAEIATRIEALGPAPQIQKDFLGDVLGRLSNRGHP